mmetsp:Transcript_28728/g.77341  ORF Transcript_28728/g.77341 Transcript_28728/m.77341 type:complete len:223 (+) Transcript_28728:1074-1742(+)
MGLLLSNPVAVYTLAAPFYICFIMIQVLGSLARLCGMLDGGMPAISLQSRARSASYSNFASAILTPRARFWLMSRSASRSVPIFKETGARNQRRPRLCHQKRGPGVAALGEVSEVSPSSTVTPASAAGLARFALARGCRRFHHRRRSRHRMRVRSCRSRRLYCSGEERRGHGCVEGGAILSSAAGLPRATNTLPLSFTACAFLSPLWFRPRLRLRLRLRFRL